jgi:hypothetical protein
MKNVCTTCGRPAGSPYRVFDKHGKVLQGCIDDFHTGHLVTPSESSRWHNRPEAKKHRASIKKHLRKNPSVMQAPDLREKPPTTKPKPQAPTLPKKNPALRYFLKIQKGGGPVMTWNGERFTNNEPFHAFSKVLTAKSTGKTLLKKFRTLEGYRIWVESKFTVITPAINSGKRRAMRGGSKMNPSRRNVELDQAAKKLEDFTGHPVQHLESAYSRSNQKTGLIVGELDLVGYRATRDGKTERYGHHFKKNSRPLLAVTSDGKQLHIVGGRYEFTEAGIEDR